MKRIVCLILCVLLLSAAAIPTHAAETNRFHELQELVSLLYGITGNLVTGVHEQIYMAAERYLKEYTYEGSEYFDQKEYDENYWDYAVPHDVLVEALNKLFPITAIGHLKEEMNGTRSFNGRYDAERDVYLFSVTYEGGASSSLTLMGYTKSGSNYYAYCYQTWMLAFVEKGEANPLEGSGMVEGKDYFTKEQDGRIFYMGFDPKAYVIQYQEQDGFLKLYGIGARTTELPEKMITADTVIPENTFEGKLTTGNITLSASANVFPAYTVVQAQPVEEQDVPAIGSALGEDYAFLSGWNISAECLGEPVQPNGKVKLELAVDSSINLSDVLLLHIKDDGTVEQPTWKEKDGKIVVSIEHFSYILLAQRIPAVTTTATAPDSPSGDINNDSILWIIIGAAVLLAIQVVIVVIRMKKS